MDDIELRVMKLEILVENHIEDLLELRNTSVQLAHSLNAIDKTLTQLKWLAIGVSVALFAKEIGIEKLFGMAVGA